MSRKQQDLLFGIQKVFNYIEENIWQLLQESDIKNKVESLRLISNYLVLLNRNWP